LVTPNGSAARWLVEGAIRPNPASTALLALGEAFHPFHDSWSHQGVPDIPFNLRPTLVSAHPEARGGWRSHDADKTHLHVEETIELAEETYELLLRFRSQNPNYGQQPAEPWSKLVPIVAEFAKASTKAQKDAWAVKFTAMSMASAGEFSAPLTLTGFPKRQPTSPLAIRPNTIRVSASVVPPELLKTAQQFLDTWITQRNVAGAVAFVDLASLTPIELLKENDALRGWCARIFTMYFADDHGAVNDAGHGDPRHPRYQLLPQVVQFDGLFRSSLEKVLAPRLSSANFVPTDAQSDFALAVQFANQPNDALALVWRQVQGQWRITLIMPIVT
jgi:hypothetical protein